MEEKRKRENSDIQMYEELVKLYEKQDSNQLNIINGLMDLMEDITKNKEKESNSALKVIVITMLITFSVLIMFIIFCYFWTIE